MRGLWRVGGAASIAEGIALFGLTVYFGVLFPRAGISSPADFGDPSKYLPVVAAHPSWFYVPAWGFGLIADAAFLVALVALREQLRSVKGSWGDVTVLFGTVGITLYLMGHVVNVAWGSELISAFSREGLTPSIAAQYTVLSRIYSGAMVGGSAFTGIALVVLGGVVLRTRIYPPLLGALSIVAGALDAAAVVTLLPPALPLTGAVLVWLGLRMWRHERAPATGLSVQTVG